MSSQTILRYLLPGACVLVLAAAVVPVAAGCGGAGNVVSTATASGTGASGTGGEKGTGGAGTGASPACHADPPGAAFTFHVHNGGAQMLRLGFGCGATLPIVLDTPKGTLGISPGPADTCEFSCEAVYAGMTGQGCSDCSGGTGPTLGPGVTVDIPWDHRVYTEIMVDPSCKGASTSQCALGEDVAGSSTQKGTLTVCTDVGDAPGYCNTSEMVSFTLDTTQASGTVEVM